MRSVKIVGFAVGICALVIGILASNRVYSANSTPSGSIVRWDYAQLYIGDDKIVLMGASRESTITPPTESLPPNDESRILPNSGRYVVDSKATRNDTVGVLDLCGSAGWEVVSNTPSGKGTVVLLKRPY